MATRSVDPGFDARRRPACRLRSDQTSNETRIDTPVRQPVADQAASTPSRQRRRDRVGGTARHSWSSRSLHLRRGTAAERERSRPGARDDGHAGLLRRHGNSAAAAERISPISTIARAPPQVVVNEELVRRFLDRREPLGRRVEAQGTEFRHRRRGTQLALQRVRRAAARRSCTFRTAISPAPSARFTCARGRDRKRRSRRTSGGLCSELDPELPVYDIRTLNDHIESNLIFRRMPARMFAVLAPLLLVLAAIGIYAVVSLHDRAAHEGDRRSPGTRRDRQARGRRSTSARASSVVASGRLIGWMVAFCFAMLSSSGSIDADRLRRRSRAF